MGIIGTRVAASLRGAGHPVFVWSRSPRPEPNFLASPREIAESADVLQIFVSDGQALLEVIKAMGDSLGEAHVVMNHATVSPSETMEAARLVTARGAAFLDAPFTGSRDAADEGQIIYYVGGEESVLERACPGSHAPWGSAAGAPPGGARLQRCQLRRDRGEVAAHALG